MDGAQNAQGRLRLLDSEVHVWLQRTDDALEPGRADALQELLDTEETRRLRRFLREKDRRSFLVAHALLRRVLSWYADVAPREWSFSVDPLGRPEISAPDSAPPLRFNISHTEGLVACAVALDCECGVDVEALGRRGNPLRVAQRVLAPRELADVETQPDSEQRERFLTYWTLKEALLKALGVGLTLPPRELSFSLQGPGIRVDCRRDITASRAAWQFASLRPTDEHVLALATGLAGGPPRTLRVREGPPVAD